MPKGGGTLFVMGLRAHNAASVECQQPRRRLHTHTHMCTCHGRERERSAQVSHMRIDGRGAKADEDMLGGGRCGMLAPLLVRLGLRAGDVEWGTGEGIMRKHFVTAAFLRYYTASGRANSASACARRAAAQSGVTVSPIFSKLPTAHRAFSELVAGVCVRAPRAAAERLPVPRAEM